MPVHENGDAVNHPKHYNSHPSGVECIDVVRHHNFNVGNAIKYLWRASLKNTGRRKARKSEAQIEDLNKAIWYLQDEVARLQSEQGDDTIDSAVVVAATRQASPPPSPDNLEGGDPPRTVLSPTRRHDFDPGYSGMSELCNQLVMRSGSSMSADICALYRDDEIHAG